MNEGDKVRIVNLPHDPPMLDVPSPAVLNNCTGTIVSAGNMLYCVLLDDPHPWPINDPFFGIENLEPLP